MRFCPNPMSLLTFVPIGRVASLGEHWSLYGCGVWAVTDKATGDFIGHCDWVMCREDGEVEAVSALTNPTGAGASPRKPPAPACVLDLKRVQAHTPHRAGRAGEHWLAAGDGTPRLCV